jgi:hypothetical protein
MRRFKQFLTEANVYKDTYINGDLLPLHPDPNEGAALVFEISKLDEFRGGDKFQVISKETFDGFLQPKYKIAIPKNSTKNPVYVKQSNDVYAIEVTSDSKEKVKNAFYGGPTGGGLSGNEGELFWEYVSWVGVTNGNLDDLLEPTNKHLEAVSKIDRDKLRNVIKSNSETIKYIYNNSQELRDGVKRGIPTVYARWDGLLIDDYYSYMKNNAKNYVRAKQKDNVADAVWIWGNDFIGSGRTGLHFISTPGSKIGLVDVWETPEKGKPIAQMLQVSLKKGKAEAQGGGTTDALKGQEVFSADMRAKIQARASGENITVELIDIQRDRGGQYDGVEEGVLDYVKAGLQKAKNIFSKLFGFFDGLIKRIVSAYEGKGKRQFFKFAKRAGIDASMLTENFIPEQLENISGHVLEEDFEKLLRTVEGAQAENKFKVVYGPEAIIKPNLKWFAQRKRESSTEQQAALNYIIINEVALWVIGNMATRSHTIDSKELVKEMADFIWDIKMGDTKLPVVQLYGDANKWEILDRGKSDTNITAIHKYMEDLGDLTFYPLVAHIYGQKQGKPWNVTHLYVVKSMTTGDYPEPVYFKMVLRGDGSTPKINSENDYYLWNNSGFVKYKG